MTLDRMTESAREFKRAQDAAHSDHSNKADALLLETALKTTIAADMFELIEEVRRLRTLASDAIDDKAMKDVQQ